MTRPTDKELMESFREAISQMPDQLRPMDIGKFMIMVIEVYECWDNIPLVMTVVQQFGLDFDKCGYDAAKYTMAKHTTPTVETSDAPKGDLH